MTDHDIQDTLDALDDAWAGHAFDRARTPHDEPHWLPDIAGAVRLSNRRRRRTRFTTAAAVVVVAGLAATDYAVLRPGYADRAPGPEASTARTVPKSDRELAAELGEFLAFRVNGRPISPPSDEPAWPSPTDAKVPTAVAEGMVGLLHGLDPDSGHIRPLGPVRPVMNALVGPDKGGWATTRVALYGYWTPDGVPPTIAAQQSRSVGYGTVSIEVGSVTDPTGINDTGQKIEMPAYKPAPCGIVVNGLFGEVLSREMNVDWSPCAIRALQDGSKVTTTHATNVGAGHAIMARRVYADGSYVTVVLTDYLVQDSSQGYWPTNAIRPENPGFVYSKTADTGWTEESLARALSTSEVVALKPYHRQ